MNEKYLFFTTGGGSSDPRNFSKDEAALFPASTFKGIRPSSGTSLDLFFEGNFGAVVVTLSISNGVHTKGMMAVANAIVSSSQSVIVIADVDGGRFINKNIYAVSIN